MAEVNNNTNSTEKNNNNKRFQIFMDEYLDFNGIADSKYITSKELCETVSSVMKQVYADWYGCIFRPIPQQNNVLSLLFYFDHEKQDDSNPLPYACTKDAVEDKSTNSTIRSIRNRDLRLATGDAYHLTKEGKEGLTPLLMNNPNFFNRGTGEVKWNKIITDIADPSAQYMYGGPHIQYTQVSFIDVTKIVTLIYGDTDEDGNHYEYTVRIAGSLPSVNLGGYGNTSNNYMLNIQKISAKETEKLARDCGFTFNSGLDIIR